MASNSLLAVALVPLMLAAPLAAQPQPTPVQQIEMAADLADLGRAGRDPLLLVAAARLVQSSGGNPVSTEEDVLSVSGLLDEAARLSGNNEAIAGQIAETRANGDRGALSGILQSYNTLRPTEMQTFDYVFAGDELAEASVRIMSQLAGSALEVAIVDAGGKPISGSLLRERERSVYMKWNPKRCGRFRITVQNRGPAPVSFKLTTQRSASNPQKCIG